MHDLKRGVVALDHVPALKAGRQALLDTRAVGHVLGGIQQVFRRFHARHLLELRGQPARLRRGVVDRGPQHPVRHHVLGEQAKEVRAVDLELIGQVRHLAGELTGFALAVRDQQLHNFGASAIHRGAGHQHFEHVARLILDDAAVAQVSLAPVLCTLAGELLGHVGREFVEAHQSGEMHDHRTLLELHLLSVLTEHLR